MSPLTITAALTVGLGAAAAVGLLVGTAGRRGRRRSRPPSHDHPAQPQRRRPRSVAAAAVGAAVGWITGVAVGLPVLGVALGIAAAAGWMAIGGLRWTRARRARRLALGEAIELLVQLLPTGQGVRQSLEVLAERGPVVLRPEVGRLVERTRLVSFDTAVRETETRLDDPLGSLLAVALIVGNRSGGQLVPLFQELGRAARATELVRGQVAAEQAQGRYGAGVICCMPVAVLLVLRLVNPVYLAPYATTEGQVVLGGIALVMGLGYVWMRRILRLPEPDRLPIRVADPAGSAPERQPGAPRGRGPRVANHRGRDDRRAPTGRRPAPAAIGRAWFGRRWPPGRRGDATPVVPKGRAVASAPPSAGQTSASPPQPRRALAPTAALPLPPPPPPPRHEDDP
ncbi:MAG TPA: type II secretion system F family protein [Candidatus Micrarchaeia archaeon]|nr:type II secretion system F family protein [Candidatus Micrarchaeia archaeon]